MVAPRSVWMRLSSSRISPRSLASSEDSGSSIRLIAGERTSARPIATRCICPPDNCVALLSSLVSMWSRRATSRTLARISASGTRRIGARSAKAMFSNTERCGYSEYCWNTKATSRSAGASLVTSRPPIRIDPRSGISNPAIRRNVVVLPAPVGPSSATNSPSATVSDRSLTACVFLNALETALISTSAMRASFMQSGADRPARRLVEDRQRIWPEIEPDILSGPKRHAGGRPGLERAIARRHRHDLRRAEILGPIDLAPHHAAIGEAHMLGPNPEHEIALREFLARSGNGNFALAEPDRLRASLEAGAERQEVHRRRADEVGNEQRRRPVIDVARTRDLLDDAVVHHRDHVGHRHGLQLIMRNVDRRRSEPIVQRAQFADHRLAHCGIECAERLVHQETFWLAHDRPSERDALPIATGKTRHRKVEKMRNAQDARRLHHPPVGLGCADALAFQGEADVSPDVHMRVEGKELEHEGDIARRGAVHRDVLAVKPDGAGGRQFKPGNHAERRRLAAAGGAQQAEELAVLHREAGSLDGMEIGEGFVERFDFDLRHPLYSLTFETMMNITVPNSVVANDQEYSVRKNGCISMTTPAAMIDVAVASSGPRRGILSAKLRPGMEEFASLLICARLQR